MHLDFLFSVETMIKNIVIGLFLFATILASAANAEQSLTAAIIGSGSPIYDENRASASVLISNGETHILVDMGNGTQGNLHKLDFQARNLSALVFTHHHLDHNEEFVPIFISNILGQNDFTIVGPPNTRKFAEENLDLYAQDIEYRLSKTQRTLADRKKAFTVTDIEGGESFKVGEINVSTIEVPHTIHTIAYRFDYNSQSIVVTGDLTYSEDLPELAKDADFMIIDSGGMVMSNGRNNKQNNKKKGRNGRVQAHLDLNDSSMLAAKSNVKNLVYTHFVPGDIDTQASMEKIRKNYSGNVVFGEDLMVLNNTVADSTKTSTEKSRRYTIVDTGQTASYSNDAVIASPAVGADFFGQDGSYVINSPSYTDNQDGTIFDNVTGLTWQQGLTEKLTYEEALEKVKTFSLAGHADWRIPTIKELYSLIQFTGSVKGEKAIAPFIDTHFFTQPLGDSGLGEREIDAQVWSSSEYVGKTMANDDTIFGVNFVDGRIKGYPKNNPRTHDANKMYFRFVRDNDDYGKNNFVDNNDGTITDDATGLVWQKEDSNQGLSWEDALAYAEELSLGGHDDWRLPNAKELQSIVDYTRSPTTSNSAAIDPVFDISSIINEGDEQDYPYFWTSTTHLDGPVPESSAVYLAFGKALGKMHGTIMDVHGAGAQRSDPKTGQAMSRGPQGDMIRVNNYVRAVRGGAIDNATDNASQPAVNKYSQLTNSTPSEATTSQQRRGDTPSRSRFITRLDKNGDGKVSSDEFKGKSAQFNHLDKNNDGYISIEEAPTGPPKRKQ